MSDTATSAATSEKPAASESTSPASQITALPDPQAPSLLEELNQARLTIGNRDRFIEKLQSELADALQTETDLRAEISRINKNPFLFVLGTFDAGQVYDDLGKQVLSLSEEIMRLDGKGSLTVTLTGKPYSGGVTYEHTVKVTEPKPEKKPKIFYYSDGELTRDDPAQKRFAFEDRPNGGGTPRSSRRGQED